MKPHVAFEVWGVEYLSDGSCRDKGSGKPVRGYWKVKSGKVITVKIPNFAEEVAHALHQEAYQRYLATLITRDL